LLAVARNAKAVGDVHDSRTPHTAANCVRRRVEQPVGSAICRHTCGNNEICRVHRQSRDY